MKPDSEWLKSLKVGDEVAVDLSSRWRKNDYRICKVVKITPTGRIKLSDDTQYYPDGKKMGEYSSYPLRQITSEILDVLNRQELIRKLKFDDFKGVLSAERLNILLEWQEELIGG